MILRPVGAPLIGDLMETADLTAAMEAPTGADIAAVVIAVAVDTVVVAVTHVAVTAAVVVVVVVAAAAVTDT